MNTNFLRLVFGCVLTMLVGISIAIGQTVTGSITGVVTDQSGAFISGAHVTAHNLDTGVNTPTDTNSTGLYHILISAHRTLPGHCSGKRIQY